MTEHLFYTRIGHLAEEVDSVFLFILLVGSMLFFLWRREKQPENGVKKRAER